MKIGLYFGTFNPIHVGHLIIANYMACNTDLDEVWLVVSPQNPLKESESLLNDEARLQIVEAAVKSNTKLKVSNVEFNLPKPSYTYTTLHALQKQHPEKSFVLIMGEDNLRSFSKWKNNREIANEFELYVYPRPLSKAEQKEFGAIPKELQSNPNVKLIEAPVMKVSSSFIREQIKNNKDIRYLLTSPVQEIIEQNRYYTQ